MSGVMKVSELHNKSVDELKQERLALLREQFNLRMQRATGQLNKPHQFKQVRRGIARINTILGERATKMATPVTEATVATAPVEKADTE